MNVPPLTGEDALPDDKAVWRDSKPAAEAVSGKRISVDYGGGAIERTTGERAIWMHAQRWRFGWPSPQSTTPFEGLGLAAKE